MGNALPKRYTFLSLLRWLSAKYTNKPEIGTAQRPRDEKHRLRQTPSMGFAIREVDQVNVNKDRYDIDVVAPGLFGVNGPLPLHLTELAIQLKQNRDPNLLAFLDLFHHRWLSQYYRAWAQTQATASLDRPQTERFSYFLGSFAGDNTEQLPTLPLAKHAYLATIPHRIGFARNPSTIAATLSWYFNVLFQVEEFSLHWFAIPEEQRSYLGRDNVYESNTLGVGARLGCSIPDRQSSFGLIAGPLTLAQYLRFIPSGCDIPVLQTLVKTFVGHELAWQLTLVVDQSQIPSARLGGEQQLGRSTWLGGEMGAPGKPFRIIFAQS